MGLGKLTDFFLDFFCRVPVAGLPEIRHKTAVSTIKSTAEKAAYREKAIKAKSEELRKKNLLKKDTTNIKGKISISYNVTDIDFRYFKSVRNKHSRW